MAQEHSQAVGEDWVSFPGGELEGKRPKVLCQACREALKRETARKTGSSRASGAPRPLCFQCYRAGLDRDRAIRAAGHLDTASEERFQEQIPCEHIVTAR